MRMFNVGLIGYGKMGKIYENEIKKKKGFKIIDILNNEKIKKKPSSIKDCFFSKKTNLLIISSPINSHFKYLKLAFKSKKNIIIEKPLVEKPYQLQKVIQKYKYFREKILIHHNDVLNLEKLQILNKKNLKNITKVEMIYGCNKLNNSYKKPFFDWLPHPLSVIVNFFEEPINFKILKYSKNIKKKFFFEKLDLLITSKGIPIFIKFSNNLRKRSKRIIFYKNNDKIIYDGYKTKNQKSVKLLLEKLYNSQKINDVKKNFRVYDILFQIDKKVKQFKLN